MCGALGLGAGLARHLAWYLSYQVDGTAKATRAPKRTGRAG
jgi:hypothetical protein